MSYDGGRAGAAVTRMGTATLDPMELGPQRRRRTTHPVVAWRDGAGMHLVLMHVYVLAAAPKQTGKAQEPEQTPPGSRCRPLLPSSSW